MTKHVAAWWIPLATFLVAALLASMAGPSLGNTTRTMMSATGKKYKCKRCNKASGKIEETTSATDLTGTGDTLGQGKWECTSANPVNFFTGENFYANNDFSSGGLSPWGFTRNYLTDPSLADNSIGPCWNVGQLYRIVQNGSQLSVIVGSAPITSFTDNGNGTYTADFDYLETLTWDSVNHLLILSDENGNRWTFFDLTGSWSSVRQGRLKEYTAAGGGLTTLTYGTSGVTLDKLLQIDQIDVVPTLQFRYVFSYNLSGASVGLLASVTCSRYDNGALTTIRVIGFDYYTAGGPNGSPGALRRVRIGNGTTTLDTYYYRYNPMDGQGWIPLRMVVHPDSYERLLAAPGLGSDAAIDLAADSIVSPYADLFFIYDGQKRVIQETVQGQGCGCGTAGGRGIFTYSYSDATHGMADGPNIWRKKTVLTLPDGNQRIVYTNGVGQTMLDVFKDVSTGLQWRKHFVFGPNNELQALGSPSAVTGHDEAVPALVTSSNLPDNAGLWTLFEHYPATDLPNGAVAKYPKAEKLRQGELGTPVLQSTLKYTSRSGSTGTIYPLASKTTYKDTAGASPVVESRSYTWQGLSNQVLEKTVTLPIVPTGQNGSGAASTVKTTFDAFGRPVWMKDPDGFIEAMEYDTLSGAVTKIIVDVNTAAVSNEPAGWVTPAGGGLHLVTVAQVDALGRITKTTDPKGNVTYQVYRDQEHEVRLYPGWDSAANAPTGPIQVLRHDRSRNYREALSMSTPPTVVGGVPQGTEAIAGLQTLTRSGLDIGGRVVTVDRYVSFAGMSYTPNATPGVLNTNYYRSTRGYDVAGRVDRHQNEAGSIIRLVHDGPGRVVSQWMGTDDTPTSGDWSPTNTAGTNLLKVATATFDAGGAGDGNLTSSVLFGTDAITYTSSAQYDWRKRVTAMRGPDKVAVRYTYDNRGLITNEDRFADANSNLTMNTGEQRGRIQRFFDDRGREYRTYFYEVSSAGVVGNRLVDDIWYNARGMTIKSRNANKLFQKQAWDGAGRLTRVYTSYQDSESGYAAATTVTGDTVLEQANMIYDAAGNLVCDTQLHRLDNDTTSTGALTPNASFPMVRILWYDKLNRKTHDASYGRDNGIVRYVYGTTGAMIDPNGNGIPEEAEGTPREPNTSDDYLVGKTLYDTSGFVLQSIDNLGRRSQLEYNRLGQVTKVIENHVDGVVGVNEWASDRITEAIRGPQGRLQILRASNPKGTSVELQETKYLYESAISLSWPTNIISPDSSDTTSAGTDQSKYVYDRLGRVTQQTDPRGVVRAIAYDAAGRRFSDTATTVPATVDAGIRRIETTYNDLSSPVQVTSFDAVTGGTIKNQVALTYGGRGEIRKLEQAHSGAVVAGTTPAMSYTYVDGAVSGVAKYFRIHAMSYPGGGRTVYANYPAAGSIGDHADRVDNLSEDAAGLNQLAKYTYFGQSQLAKMSRPQVSGGLNLDYGSGGTLAGLDRFGRVADQKWSNDSGTTLHDRFQYAFNRGGLVISKKVAASGAPTGMDEAYVYDGMNRLTQVNRGTLSGGTITQAAATFNQQWTQLEHAGNWGQWRWDSNGGANSWTTQARKHNRANEIDVDNDDANAAGASITGTNSNWVDPTYDKAGNLVSGPKPGEELLAPSRQWFTYDAWGRLVTLKADAAGAPGATVATYGYDGMNQRISKVTGGVTLDYYYNADSQLVEVRRNGSAAPKEQYVWDGRYIDALAVRYRDANDDGTMEEKLFYVNDANFNTTSLVEPGGAVVERYAYDPYGKHLIFAGDWTPRTASSYANEVLYTGYRLDPESGLYYVRNRYYHSTLGRWTQRDPIGFEGGSSNLYEYVGSGPITGRDPFGLEDCDQFKTQWAKNITIRGKGPVDVFGGYRINLEGETCKGCCKQGSARGHTATGQWTQLKGSISLSLEIGYTWGLRHEEHWSGVRYTVFAGVRVYGKSDSSLQLSGGCDTCENTALKISFKAEQKFTAGAEVGARISMTKPGSWFTWSFGVVGRGELSLMWYMEGICNAAECRFQTRLGDWEFRLTFEGDFLITRIVFTWKTSGSVGGGGVLNGSMPMPDKLKKSCDD